MVAILSSSSIVGPLEIAKFLFSFVYVVATIGVIIGVYWEREEFPKDKRDKGWRLLVRSLAVDTLFTILIIGTDGWIGAIQRAEIIGLETRLAARSLSDDQAENMRRNLRQFPGQSFEVITYWQNKESLGIANRIADTLISAGWQIDQPKSFTTLVGVVTGLYVSVDKAAAQSAKDAERALVEALNRNGIDALEDSEHENPNPTNKININVGIKP